MRLAIVGATGLVAQTLLDLLDEQDVALDALHLIASERSAGRLIHFRDKQYSVESLCDFDFSVVDVAIFSAGTEAALNYAPKAVAQGCWVIDNSSAFRYQDDVPLVIPGINDALLLDEQVKVISNPNCSTIQLLKAIHPLFEAYGIAELNVSTYQAVSGQGAAALDKLKDDSALILEGAAKQVSNQALAFNCVPMIDVLQDNGFSREEMKMVWESQKILASPELVVNPTAVRVPVFNGHAMTVHLRTMRSFVFAEVKKLFSLRDELPTQRMVDNTNEVYVGRLRQQLFDENGLNFWVVADNLRVGAALNALEILNYIRMNHVS